MKTQRKLLDSLKSLDFNDPTFIEMVERLFKDGHDSNLKSPITIRTKAGAVQNSNSLTEMKFNDFVFSFKSV